MPKGKLVSKINPSKSLLWNNTEGSIYPPAVVEIDGEFYLISGSEADEYYSIKAESKADALNLSVKLHGTPDITKLAEIAVICESQGIDHVMIKAFTDRGIKGRQSFETLRAVAKYPDVLKKYLTVKDTPLKTLAVFNKLNENCQNYIIDNITVRELSVGDFRNLVNLLFDMMPKIKPEDLQGDITKKLSAEKDAARLSFLKDFNELIKNLPVTVSSPDNFETGRLVFSFTAESAEEFLQIITSASAESNTSKLKEIYGFLDEQDIS